MRITKALCAVALSAAAVSPVASAAPPHPDSCTATVEGVTVPANPGGIVATAAVVAVAGEVVCVRDVLASTIGELATPYEGHIDLDVYTDTGVHVCDVPFLPVQSAGPVLAMAHAGQCVLDVTNPYRTRPLRVRLRWAAMPPYVCCGDLWANVSPAGVAVR